MDREQAAAPGPLELVPEDALALGLLVLLGTTLPDFTSLYIINIFLICTYHYCDLVTFWKTGAPAYGYCAVLFLGFIPQMWRRQWVDFAILAGIYLVVHEGLWRALRKFPWQSEGFCATSAWNDTLWEPTRIPPAAGLSIASTAISAWRRGSIGSTPFCAPCWEAGGSGACARSSSTRVTRSALRSCLSPLATITSPQLRRCLIYVRGYRSPISFWGRIWTFRLIIPGYDQVYVGPICSLLRGSWFLPS